MKIFTLDEANALLPALQSLLDAVRGCQGQLEEQQKLAEQTVQRVSLSGGVLLKVSAMIEQKRQREHTAGRLRDLLAEIAATGALVKDVDTGLLDFPCEVGGEIILLCWKRGEPAIAYWHGLEEGFQGRKPIDGRISGPRKLH
jgi:hypothetical protein